MRIRIGIIALVLLAAMTSAVFAFDLPKIKLPTEKLGLDRLLQEDPPITTSFEDALYEVPYMDDFNPTGFRPMTQLKRGKRGFILEPGLWELHAQSYCLHAGTYGPSRGEGYLLAPLKGPRAAVIRSILQNSVDHPEIPQHDIQVLIWAVEARTKISEMPPKMQQTAAALLSKDQIKSLNGGIAGLMPDQLTGPAFDKLSAPLRRMYSAQASLNQKFRLGGSNYDELERIAVLTGDPDPSENKGPEVPKGRWSYHPDGYYIRFFPNGYSETHIQVFVPGKLSIAWDSQGRVTSVADPGGMRIETEYDDTIPPLSIPGDDGVKAYALKRVRHTVSEGRSAEWTDHGWVFVGVPSGKGKPGAAHDRFGGLAARYEAASKVAEQIRSLHRKVVGGKMSARWTQSVKYSLYSQGVGPIVSHSSVAAGSGAGAFDSDSDDDTPRRPPIKLPDFDSRNNNADSDDGKSWWDELNDWWDQFDIFHSDDSSSSSSSSGEADMSGSVATPSNTGRQRLGLSSRSSE